MSDDRRRPGQHESRRDEALRRWIAEEVHPFSEPVRAQLERSGLGRRGVRVAGDLARLPVTELGDLGDGRGHVLEPTAERIQESAGPGLRVRLMAADVLGRREGFARHDVDLPYKPVRWTVERHVAGPLFVAATNTDLDRLAALGRRALAVSGITPADRLLCTGAGIGPLQLELGARDAGVAHLVVESPLAASVLADAAPTVVAGPPATLSRLVDAGLPASVRLLVAHVGAAGGEDLVALRRRAGRPVRLWWAPPGVRAAWATCEADQLHTWPEHEHLEVVDDEGLPAESGRLVWSAVGWRGSVWLRVALGPEGRVDRSACSCGRTTPRVRGAARVRRTPEPAGGSRR
ncbi:MAG TPA: hypothetical protein VLR27_08100 [Acidimicrobiales bacterium]|nr:hypothetical protein [Acidimicrobiales bacterium]